MTNENSISTVETNGNGITNGIKNFESDSYFRDVISGFGFNDRTSNITYSRDISVTSKDIEKYEILHERNNIATNIIESLPESMGEKLPIFTYPDAEISEKINNKIAEIIPLFVDATIKARLTGGSGIFIHTPGNMETPLNEAICPESYNVLEGGVNGHLQIHCVCKNPLDANYEKPELYKFRNTSIKIHHTRILAFYGIKPITRNQKKFYKFWGMPVLQKSIEEIEAYTIAKKAIKETLDKFSRLVIEVENLIDLMRTDQGKELLKERATQSNFYWNMLRTLLISKGEKVYHLETDYEKLQKILPDVKEAVCASCDTVYSKIFNVAKSSPLSGSSSASKSVDRGDERQWSEYVHSQQIKQWLPHLRYLVDIWLTAMLGNDFDKYEIKFPTLLQLTEEEQANLDKIKAETNKLNVVDIQAVKPEEVRKSLAKGIPVESAIDLAENINMKLLEQLPNNHLINQLRNSVQPLNSPLQQLVKNQQTKPVSTVIENLTGNNSNNERGIMPEFKGIVSNDGELSDKQGFFDKDEYGYNYEDNGFPCESCVAWEGYRGETDSEDHALGDCALMGKIWGLAHCDLWEDKKSGELLPKSAIKNSYDPMMHPAGNLLDALYGHATAIVGDDGSKRKKIVKWFDWEIGLQYQPFDTRFDVQMPVGYGGIHLTRSEDGMNCDVYVGSDLSVKKLYRFWLKAPDNSKSEYKYVIGFGDRYTAEKVIKSFIPSGMVQRFNEVPISKLNEYKVRS